MQRQPRPGSELSNECQAESNGKKLLALERSASMWQTVTMVVSIAAQLGILIFSIYSISEYHVPYLLLVVQLIETIVQAVEFAWYLWRRTLRQLRQATQRRRGGPLLGLGDNDSDDAHLALPADHLL